MAYKDFKSYIQDKYCDLLTTAIKEYVDNHHDGLGFHGFSVLSLLKQKIENVEVKSLICHEAGIGDLLRIEARTAADIVEMSLGTKEIEAGRKTRWFIVHLTAELNQGLHDVKVQKTEENYFGGFDLEGALDAYLVPYICTSDLEDLADAFFERYCDDAVFDRWVFPYSHVMRKMHIQAVESTLPDNVFGRTYFKPTKIKYWYKFWPTHPEAEVEEEVPAGTIVINKEHFFLGNYGSAINTIAHELVHWEFHRRFFEILALLDENANQLSCEVTPEIPNEEMTGVEKAIWWAEWQANNLAPRIVMPRQLFLEVLAQCYDDNFTPVFYRGQYLEEALEKTAEMFGVSRYEAKVRAIQLGIMEAEGTFLYSERFYVYPISFHRWSLSKNQTFAIDRKSYEKLLKTNTEFADLIHQGLFIYAECFVVINDPLYVKESDTPHMEGEIVLTDYARENADECCMIFEREYKNDGKYDYEYYGQCYLSKELTEDLLVETKPTTDLAEQNATQRANAAKKLKEEGQSLMAIMRSLPSSFSGTFDSHMKRVKKEDGKKMTNLEMSIRTGLSEDYIASLRKDESINVSLQTVSALCIGLQLPPCFSKDMLSKSRNSFPYTDDGYFQQRILEEMYMEPLSSINEVLIESGIRSWGKN